MPTYYFLSCTLNICHKILFHIIKCSTVGKIERTSQRIFPLIIRNRFSIDLQSLYTLDPGSSR